MNAERTETVDGDEFLDKVLMEKFAVNWVGAMKLLRRVIESHDQGFVLDGELVDDIRVALGDSALVHASTHAGFAEKNDA